METSSVTTTIDGRVATVTIDRSDRRNALDDQLVRELTDVFTSLNRQQSVRAVILAGAGTAFCAGMDLDYLRASVDKGQEENLEDARALLRLLLLIHQHKKPVIARVQGPAMGGGCGLAAACDFVIAGKENARIGAPEVRLGFLPAVILLFLMKRMGEGRAREFTLRGGTLTALEAQAAGLVTEVVPDADLPKATADFAARLVENTSASSITLTKELFMRFDEMKRTDALDYAATLNALSRKTEDFKRGIESFLSREKLKW
jgi:methylglutaconyl-CoA hydratase